MGSFKLLGLLFAIIATTCGLPSPRINDQEAVGLGVGTDNVASSILKAKFNTRENVVFAPFGYSAILAMLGEGARGDTQKEIQDFLRLRGEANTRDTFRALLTRYSVDEPATVPQFKTWFYVYENNSVNEDFVKTLRDDYLVEVKTIQRNFYDFDEPSEVAAEIAAAPPVKPSSEVQVSEDVPEKVVLADAPQEEQNEAVVAVKESFATKDIPGVVDDDVDVLGNVFDEVDLDGKNLAMPTDIDEILKQKECSRFDEEVDDQQYVEVQSLREGDPAAQQAAAAATAAVASSQPEDNETVHPIEKLEELKKIVKIDDNAESLKQLDDMEEMGVLAVARKHPVTKKFQAAAGRALEEINDVSSALSANSLMGRKEDSSDEQESKMLLFNGLYFRGKWKTPFQRLRSESDPGNVFYMQDATEPVEVAMMRSRGEFRTAFSAALKAQIIELPYEKERYAMIVVMPVERDNGLKNLVDRLDYATIKQLSSELKLRTVELSLPKFNVETTSTVHKEFAEMGLATLFSEAADLSGITGQQRLRVDELVQHVSVRVDEGASTENSISASDGVGPRLAKSEAETEEPKEEQGQAAAAAEETFIVNRPFLFFVRDTIDDVTLVAGMINKPKGPQLFADFITQDRSTGSRSSP